MAICYNNNKQLSSKNKWQTQKIHKQCKNNASSTWHDYNYNYYSNNSYNKPFKISPFDLKDYDKSIKTNNIPIWICSRCTFKNTKRKSHCTACNISYKQSKSLYIPSLKSKSKSTPTSIKQRGFSNKPSNNNVVLADFCNNIMDEINQSIPVWICNECTYCNIEQLPQCQMCLNSYHQNLQYSNLLKQSQSPSQENYEYFSAAEQKLILESVEFSTKKFNDKPPPKRNKFSIDFLKSFQSENECESMPENIITPIDDILAPKLGLKAYKNNKRAKFSVNQLRKLQNKNDYKIMPQHITNEVPEILAPGLGTKSVKKQRKRSKFSMDKLLGLRNKKEHKIMPDNIITEIPQILAPGLGSNKKESRAKFNMKQLLRFKDKASCKLMPDNIINDIPEILGPKLGAKKELLKFRNNASFKTMPDEIINDIPDILAPGLGLKCGVRKKFDITKLKELGGIKSFKCMPDNIINAVPEIFAPGLVQVSDHEIVVEVESESRQYDMALLTKLRFKDGYGAMPATESIINDIPEILAPGLGMRRKYEIQQLKNMRTKKGYQDMPDSDNLVNNIPSEILAPGLGTKAKRRRRKFSMDRLMGLRSEDGYDTMPSNIMSDIPEILAPGLGSDIGNNNGKGSKCDGNDEILDILSEDCGVNDSHFYNHNDDEDDDDFGDGVEIVSQNENHQHSNKDGCIDNKWRIDIGEHNNDQILSFELKTTVTIKETKSNNWTAIGFIAKRRFNNNYFMRYKRNEYTHYRQTEINDNKYTKSCYYRDKTQTMNNTKEIEIEIEKEQRIEISQDIELQTLYGSPINKESPRQLKMNRRRMKEALKQERNKLWENKKVNDPRWNNKNNNKSNYKQLSQRYVANKWCAYWKISQI